MKPLSVICLRLLMQLISCAFRFADASAGSSSAARMAMMAMTTSSSIRVNPCGEGLWTEGFVTSNDKQLLSAAPLVLDVARVRENCLPLFLIPEPTYQVESRYAKAFCHLFSFSARAFRRRLQ